MTTHAQLPPTPALTDFLNRLKSAFGERIQEAKLFGSYARGTPRPDSDIDILIVLDTVCEEDRDVIIDLVREAMQEYGEYIATHIYSQKEYERLNAPPTPFMQIVRREAIPLW